MRSSRATRLAALLIACVLRAHAAEPCRGEAYDLARRFEGTWEEYRAADGRETLDGVLTTALDAGGCALTQTFLSRDGSLSFRTLGYVDPQSGQWLETYVLSNGRVANYRWRTQGDHIFFHRIAADAKSQLRYRIRFSSKDEYEVILERSPSGEEAWTAETRTIARRAPATSR